MQLKGSCRKVDTAHDEQKRKIDSKGFIGTKRFYL